MTDLVERLNRIVLEAESIVYRYDEQQAEPFDSMWRQDIKQAATEIERLQAEKGALIEVLHQNGISVDLSALKEQT